MSKKWYLRSRQNTQIRSGTDQIRDRQDPDLSDNPGHNQSRAVSQLRGSEWEQGEESTSEEHSAGEINYTGFKDLLPLKTVAPSYF